MYSRKYVHSKIAVFVLLCSVWTFLTAVMPAQTLNWQQMKGIDREDVQCFASIGTVLFAGTFRGGSVYRSNDNGATWSVANSGLPTNTAVFALAVMGSSLFAGGYAGENEGGGVFRSTDNGTTWTVLNTGIPDRYVSALTVSGTTIIAAGTRGGIFRSTDGGTTWTKLNVGIPSTFVRVLTTIGTTIFAGLFDGFGIYRSTDNGTTWTKLNTVEIIKNQNLVNTFTVNGTTIFAGTGGQGSNSGVFRSNDNGTTWTEVSTGIYPHVKALTVSGTTIFAGTGGNGVYRSTDNGTTWTAVGPANIGMYLNFGVNALIVSGSTLFAGTGSFITGGSVFRAVLSTSSLLTLSGSSLTFGSVQISSISTPQFYTLTGSNLTTDIKVTAPAGFQVATSQNGSYSSSLSLSSTSGSLSQTIFVRFAPLGIGFIAGNITHTSASTSASVAVSGIATNPVSVRSSDPQVSSLRIAVAPHPITDQTRLTVELRKAASVEVNIFDALGRLVQQRLLGEFAEGVHEIEQTMDALPTGIFTVVVRAGTEQATKIIQHIR